MKNEAEVHVIGCLFLEDNSQTVARSYSDLNHSCPGNRMFRSSPALDKAASPQSGPKSNPSAPRLTRRPGRVRPSRN
ncbi:hypothetical protein J6590_068608 [Homalodisca vitripennis]|nr:hypothetical protein J6590_068608 [Homalodisca vitripennis]